MDYLAAQGMDDFTAVTLDTVNTYIRTLAGFSYKTVEQHICSLRAFCRFLYQEGIMPDDLSAKMPIVKARKQTAIPSVWTHEELKQLVGASRWRAAPMRRSRWGSFTPPQGSMTRPCSGTGTCSTSAPT